MNDLKNGIFDINGFLIGPNTTIQEIEEQLNVKAKLNDEWAFFHFEVENLKINFEVSVSFYNEKLFGIKLYPQLPEIAAKYSLKPYSEDCLTYFKELRVIMDAWLFEQLGEPHYKDTDVTEYHLSHVFISTCAYINERTRDFDICGGKVRISYE